MIQSRKDEFGGVTLAQVEAKMNLAKTAFDASGMAKDETLNQKWGLVRKAWIAGCKKLPVSHVELGTFSLAVLQFQEGVSAASQRISISEMVQKEIADFAVSTRGYYLAAVPASSDPYHIEVRTDDPEPAPAPAPEPAQAEPAAPAEEPETPVEEPPPPEAAAPLQDATPAPTRDIPPPEEFGDFRPMGGRATEPPAPSGTKAEPPPPDPGRVGGSRSSSQAIG